MLAIAVVLAVMAGVLLVLTIAASVNVVEGERLSVYAALLGVAIVVLAGTSLAMFTVLFPQARK